MKRTVYFFQYLPPWRIDVFNEMARCSDLTLVFFNAGLEGFTYDREALLGRLQGMQVRFLDTGFNVGTRPVRTGIGSLLAELRPEVVYVHEYSQVSVTLALLKRRFGYRLYITTSDNPAMAEASSGLKALSRRFVLSRSDGAVLYSEAVERFYRSRFPGLRTAVCPNIQDPRTLAAFREVGAPDPCPDGRRLILYAGRLVPVKGVDLLLDAFAAVPHTGYVLALVGEGTEKEKLIAQANQLGIAREVIFAGFSSGAAFYRWYDRADFLVLPSRYEPFGAVVNEALALGCPVLCSRYAGAVDFMTPENGLIFDPQDRDAFIETLRTAMARFPAPDGPRNNRMAVSFQDAVHNLIGIDDRV
ncbi:MAG: glycosyltransferase [Bacteroidales bacterium]|nr:glycosyltransferase [Bacteroidales bacterium]